MVKISRGECQDAMPVELVLLVNYYSPTQNNKPVHASAAKAWPMHFGHVWQLDHSWKHSLTL